jgi:phosphomannomutase
MGPSKRSGDERGGLKILLQDKERKNRAFLWMRGSGTEPVFRLLVDVEGERPELFDYLLNWQRSMIEEADSE